MSQKVPSVEELLKKPPFNDMKQGTTILASICLEKEPSEHAKITNLVREKKLTTLQLRQYLETWAIAYVQKNPENVTMFLQVVIVTAKQAQQQPKAPPKKNQQPNNSQQQPKPQPQPQQQPKQEPKPTKEKKPFFGFGSGSKPKDIGEANITKKEKKKTSGEIAEFEAESFTARFNREKKELMDSKKLRDQESKEYTKLISYFQAKLAASNEVRGVNEKKLKEKQLNLARLQSVNEMRVEFIEADIPILLATIIEYEKARDAAITLEEGDNVVDECNTQIDNARDTLVKYERFLTVHGGFKTRMKLTALGGLSKAWKGWRNRKSNKTIGRLTKKYKDAIDTMTGGM